MVFYDQKKQNKKDSKKYDLLRFEFPKILEKRLLESIEKKNDTTMHMDHQQHTDSSSD